MSSGHPEGPSTNPDDWKSPYSTGPGQTPGYGEPYGYEPPQQEPQPEYGRPGHQPGYGQDQAHAQNPGQDYGSGQGYGQTQGPGQFYGQGQGYGQQPPYGQYPPYAQGYGPGPQPGSDGTRTHAIVALVISLVFALSCYVSLGGIAGAILSGLALGKVDRDVKGARKLLRWTWISIGINIALIVLGVATFIIAGLNGAFDSY
ncbi:hypothetical protein AB0M44_49065 [Streptosporangium subroseum]|uniref:hypothetical protein n=1 Tax=Streptosporangium subroseum TaxID=106412 RepID=UPI00341BA94C